jgi:hypothetical protein
MTRERLLALSEVGWRLSRDGSTSTAYRAWDDPLDPESGWELLVLYTAGHGSRLTVNGFGSGLTERPRQEAEQFEAAFTEAMELVRGWSGEPLEEDA